MTLVCYLGSTQAILQYLRMSHEHVSSRYADVIHVKEAVICYVETHLWSDISDGNTCHYWHCGDTDLSMASAFLSPEVGR